MSHAGCEYFIVYWMSLLFVCYLEPMVFEFPETLLCIIIIHVISLGMVTGK